MNHSQPAANGLAPRRAPAATLRVFYALWPDAAVLDALAGLTREVAAQTQGRAPPASNLHLTLAFVGDVAPEHLAALQAIGAAAAAGVSPFTLTLDRTGSFRGTGIAWLGAAAVPASLDVLARSLAEALAAEGYASDRRPFSPHVTLARRCRRPSDVALATPLRWNVDRLVLNASELRPGAPAYRELASWALGAPLATRQATGTV
jgi:2'-5' RNA ligase